MTASNLSVLSALADDAAREHVAAALAEVQREGWLMAETSPDDLAARLAREPWSCALVDARAIAVRPRPWLPRVVRAAPATALIVVTPEYDAADASAALELGVQDVVAWPECDALPRAIRHALARHPVHSASAGAYRAAVARTERADPLDGATLATRPLDQVVAPHRCHEPLAALSIACDGLQYVADAWGRCARGELLAEIARRVRLLTRPGDVLARIGGDALLLLLLPGTGGGAAAEFAERVRRVVLARPVEAGGRRIPASVSVGVAVVSPRARFADACALGARALAASRSSGRDSAAGIAAALADLSRPHRRWALRALRGGGGAVASHSLR
jgi:diguanylate cyclase (GGDEF)-like protein